MPKAMFELLRLYDAIEQIENLWQNIGSKSRFYCLSAAIANSDKSWSNLLSDEDPGVRKYCTFGMF